MSCGCQKRILPNGKTGCSKCITNNNNTIKPAVKNANVAPTSIEARIISGLLKDLSDNEL